MPLDTTDVTLDSSSKNNRDDASPERNQDVKKMPDGRTIEDVWAENQRKESVIKEVRAELSETKERLEQLERISEERELTAREKREFSELETDAKQQAKILRSQKESQAWIEIAREEASTEAERKAVETVFQNEIQRQNDFLEDKAEEMGVSVKELANKLKEYSSKYNHLRPERKAQRAYRDYVAAEKKIKEISERERALKEREEEDLRFRETGRRSVGKDSLESKFEKSENKTLSAIEAMEEAARLRRQRG